MFPRADLILTLRDGGARLSAPITAGCRTLWVRNEGPHAHRALFARLESGRSPDEARLRWLHWVSLLQRCGDDDIRH